MDVAGAYKASDKADPTCSTCVGSHQSESTSPVTFRLEQAEIAELDRLALIKRRSRSHLLAVAVRRYIYYERDFLAAVQERIDEARAGQVVGHDVILADSAARRQRSRTL